MKLLNASALKLKTKFVDERRRNWKTIYIFCHASSVSLKLMRIMRKTDESNGYLMRKDLRKNEPKEKKSDGDCN